MTPVWQPGWGRRAVFLGAVVGCFVFLNIGYLHWLLMPLGVTSLMTIWMFELAMWVAAYELAAAGFAVVGAAPVSRTRAATPSSPPVALVCVTCDDVDPAVLAKLGEQRYPDLEVFILDDSESPIARTMVDSLPFTVVRRAGRAGFKGGNLNHWVERYSKKFRYLAVADADSVLPAHFVSQMVEYAERPEYERVAILESAIVPWNTESRFVRLQAPIGRVAHWIRAHVDTALGMCLSVGHNNLYRLDALREIGGFAAEYLAEDYATAVRVWATGHWGCAGVPVVSYERAPANVTEYTRREARWAFQAFQLMSLDIAGTPVLVRLKLLMTLMHYARYVLAAGALALLGGVWSSGLAVRGLGGGGHSRGPESVSALGLYAAAIVLLPALAWLLVAARIREPLARFVGGMWLHASLFSAALWPVIRRLAAVGSPRRGMFDVTGSAATPGLSRLLHAGAPAYVTIWAVTLLHLGAPFAGSVNLLWLVPAALAPLLLHYMQRD
jgi:Glycosyl transferase family group 2